MHVSENVRCFLFRDDLPPSIVVCAGKLALESDLDIEEVLVDLLGALGDHQRHAVLRHRYVRAEVDAERRHASRRRRRLVAAALVRQRLQTALVTGDAALLTNMYGHSQLNTDLYMYMYMH